MTRARVLIADDHQILAEGIRSLLEPEFEVVAVVSDGRKLVAAAKELLPEVIVADISMPSLNGIEAAALVRSAGLSAKVVFLTMHRDVAYARRALEAGAVGLRAQALRLFGIGDRHSRGTPGEDLHHPVDCRGTAAVLSRR